MWLKKQGSESRDYNFARILCMKMELFCISEEKILYLTGRCKNLKEKTSRNRRREQERRGGNWEVEKEIRQEGETEGGGRERKRQC